MSRPTLTDIVGYVTPTAALAALAALWKFLVVDRVRRAERERDEYRELWQREVKLGAKRALMPRAPSDPPPAEIPIPDDWNEKSSVTRERKLLEREVTDEALRQFIQEKTPPKMFATKQADVVIIDDDEATVRALHRLVIPKVPKDWRVAPTVDPEEGRLWLLEPSVKFAIVDLNMPRLNGRELLDEMLALRPELRGRIIVCSGTFPDDDDMRHLTRELGCLWLSKPCQMDEFDRVIRMALK